jgi:signal transduction histidine kinase
MNTDKAANAAENLVRESARASAVVDRVRSLFSERDLLRKTTDLNLLVNDVVQLLRDDAVRRSVLIHLELSDTPLLASVDPVQIRQVMLNLVTNGMESTVETGRPREVVISSALNGMGQVMITVRDNGAGLTEHVKEKMFEPFFTTKPYGTGIGLSICRSIVEAHNGRIWADALRQGAAFHVVLGSGE